LRHALERSLVCLILVPRRDGDAITEVWNVVGQASSASSTGDAPLLGSVRDVCLRNGNPRDLHEPGQVRPGLQQRQGHETRPGIPQHLRAVVRQRRRSPPPHQDSDVGQRSAESLDEITRLRRRTGWQIGEADDREPLRVDERHQFRGLQARTGNLDVKL